MSKPRSYPSPAPPPPSSMAGIFTRSRAEIFLHRTRSGHARPDPSRRNLPHHHQLLPPLPTQPPASAPAPAPPTFISIKDLRTHRVFSPADEQTATIDGFEEKGEQNEAEKSKGGDVELSPGCEACGDDETIQSTPPDLDTLRKLDYGCNGSPTVKASGEEHKLADDAAYRRPQPNLSKNRPVIVPCSRSKLYRNPKSFGYRRLLPYLLDLEKDHSEKSICSGGAEILRPLVHTKKVENNTEEVPLSMSEDPSPAQKDHVDGSENNPIVTSSENLNLTDNHVPQTFEFGPTHDVDDMIVVESTESSSAKLSTVNMDLSEKHNLDNNKSSPLQVSTRDVDDMMLIESTEGLTAKTLGENMDPKEKHVPDNSKSSPPEITLDDMIATESVDLPSDLEFLQSFDSSFHIPAGYGALSVEELAGSNPELRSFPGTLEEGCTAVMSAVEPDRKPLLAASQLGRSGPLGKHALAPKKGILKRHTRGCKGLCMCLECASFRLHAERAFEFSRKQNIEADEVVTGLMKELSCLRNVMEKSVVPEARELCRRASRIEELAKIRMGQMIHELNIHCRVPGPRVAFAECFKERSSP